MLRLLLALMLLLLPSCTAPAPRPDFASSDPQERAMAIARAAASDDKAAVRPLIEALDDPDPGLRMLAIAALQRITGQTLGYDATASEAQRDAAIREWVRWAEGQGSGGATG